MKILLQIEELTKSFGDRILFDSISFGINEGDKIGIIAKNGTGKSTLLNIIAGEESPDSGNIIGRNGVKIGFLPQIPHFTPGSTVISSCLIAGTTSTDAIIEYEAAMESGDSNRINDAVHLMDAAGAWDYEDRVKQMLTQLDIHDITARVDNLSGGQLKRIAIARMLLADPDLLILDEPTNHLDIGVIEWLESYLMRSRVSLLMVTHDRYFLDRVCNKIIEMDHKSIFTYEGSYETYLRRRAERIDALTAEVDKVKNILRKETEWMRRQPQARAGKAKYRIDQYYDLKERSRADYTESNVKLDVKSSYIGSKIFEAENISKRFGDKVILDGFTYTFSRYEKLGLVGHNGVGKSTFIKMLLGMVPADSGEWNVGETVRFGYYSQDGIHFSDPKKRVVDFITDIAEDIVVNNNIHYNPMQFLQRFLFSPADQQKYIHTLSGGEKARLHLASVLMRSPNFLILDEPTNDLDIVTLGLLEEYLAEFKGCLIVVSHDRFFLDSIVDHLFVMEGNGVIKDFPGGYTDYRNFISSRENVPVPAKKEKNEENYTPRHADRSNKLTFKEKREFEELSEKIEKWETELKDLDRLFASGAELEDIKTLSSRYNELKNLLDEAELRWLELSEKE